MAQFERGRAVPHMERESLMSHKPGEKKGKKKGKGGK
jgi:hypothetical protein